LVERSETAKARIENALKQATNSHKNASAMLETFQNYDQVLNKNKDAAEYAKTETIDIGINLNECQLSLDTASKALLQSQSNLNEAVEVGGRATRLIAETAKENARLKNKTSELEKNQAELIGSVKGLTDRASDNVERVSHARMTNDSFADRFNSLQQNVERVAIDSNILISSLNAADEDIEILNADFIKSKLV